MNNSLYPLKFQPIYKSKIWGGNRIAKTFHRTDVPQQCGESWEISSIEGSESVVTNGFLAGNTITEIVEVYMGDLVGESVYDKFGISFPLLIKLIDAHQDLSVQVHPNNQLALERHQAIGKTEMWYVLESEPGARIISGLAEGVSRQEFLQSLASGKILEKLNSVEVSAGNAFFIPAGTVHSIGKGCMVVEIQQSSDITYRIFDYSRKDSNGQERQLHQDLAIDAITYSKAPEASQYKPVPNQSAKIADCDSFTVNILSVEMPIEKDFPEIDSFIIYMCVSGSCNIQYDDGSIHIATGETVLVPACISNLCFEPQGTAQLLEIYIKGE